MQEFANQFVILMHVCLTIYTAVELRNEAFRNLDINEVVNTIVEALTSSSPRDRYLVGQDAKNFLLWLTRLPTSVADYVICASVKQLQPRGASVS